MRSPLRRAEAMPATESTRVSVADVRRSFNAKGGKDPWVLAHIFRPLADLITPPFYNAGLSGNAVTGLRALVAIAAVVGLALGEPGLIPAVVVLAYVGFVLDCVDGNVVRLGDTASYFGKFADGLADGVFVFLAPFAAGFGAWLGGGPAWALLLGALVTIGALSAQMVRNRLSFFREWMISQTGPLEDPVLAQLATAQDWNRRALAVMVNVSFVAPLVLLLPGAGEKFVALLAVTQLPADLVVIALTLWQANTMLRRWRRSIHANP